MFSDYIELRKDIINGTISVTDIVKYYLVNIEKGKHLNAFLFVIKGEANNGKRFDELSGGCK
jgi:Asp-tRNA(Asn)/Glu-tRNA(Gln) amidotransferase A subunit family amidase